MWWLLRARVEVWWWIEQRTLRLWLLGCRDRPSWWFDAVTAWAYRNRKRAEYTMFQRWGSIYRRN